MKRTVETIYTVCVILAICAGLILLGMAVGYNEAMIKYTSVIRLPEPSENTAERLVEEANIEETTQPVYLDCRSESMVSMDFVKNDEAKTETTTEPAKPEEPEAGTFEDDELHLTEDDIFCLAAVIYQEAGGDECADATRYMVADVVLNRVADDRFPGTVREVLEDAPGGCLQYGRFSITGVCFPERAELESEKHAVQRAWYIAREIAAGEHSELYGNGYIWQAEFGQGTDQIWADGICFGR